MGLEKQGGGEEQQVCFPATLMACCHLKGKKKTDLFPLSLCSGLFSSYCKLLTRANASLVPGFALFPAKKTDEKGMILWSFHCS